MSKVICDVCGTSYPDTATQCPICGCVRPADAAPVDDVEREEVGYTYVKGGRFSKSNVRKRNQGVATPKVAAKAPQKEKNASDKKPVNKKLIGFIIVFACVVLILVLLAIYLYPMLNKKDEPKNDPVTEQTTIPCEGIKLSMRSFVITEANQVLNLSVTRSPLNTTDVLEYSSSNENVVSVDQKGNITYVGNGKAEIIVTCGTFKDTCMITCEVPDTTEPTEPDVSGETTAPVEIRFLTTLIQTTDYYQCDPGTDYKLCIVDDALLSEIKWTSDDPKVAEFRDGVVYMIADGTTTVHAEYGEQKLSCTVIVGSGDGYNLLPPDTDIDITQYSGWCQTAYGGWETNGGKLLNEDWRNSPFIDVSFSSGDYGVSYQFGILPIETKDAIVLKWRPLDESKVGCFDLENNKFIPSKETSGTTVIYWAEHGDEKVYLYVTIY